MRIMTAKTVIISGLFILTILQSGCQSTQFGASPIPVISYTVTR